jgi:hypothetical protein
MPIHFGGRPARCAPAKAFVPPSCHAANHCEAVSRDTLSSRATSAWVEPRLNISPARSLRYLSASKSRRGLTGFAVAFVGDDRRCADPGTR